MKRIVLSLVSIVWAGFWFWAFSFALSPGYFRHDRSTRLPIFLVCLAGACALPLLAGMQWSRATRAITRPARAFAVHVLLSGLVVALPLMLVFVLSRASGSWRLEADDAMGAGIQVALLLLVATGTIVVLGVALAARTCRRRGARGPERL